LKITRSNIIIFIWVAFSLLLFSFEKKKTSPPLSCKEVIEKMIKTIDEIQRLKYNLKITERVRDKYNNFQSNVKLNRHPRKIYLYTNGIELIWREDQNNKKAYVKPNSFPYINLNLDPLGSLMRQDQHHTIHEMGFDYFSSVIERNVKMLGSKFDENFKLEGEETANHRPCYKVSITNYDYSVVNYTVLKGENLMTIARKLNVGEFKILELNTDKVDNYNDVKPGQVIKVPSAYAKNVTLFIDKLFFVPVSTVVYDEKGLFEKYDYFFVQVNPKIEEEEFTRSYKEYGF
jgi:hypothetical protein